MEQFQQVMTFDSDDGMRKKWIAFKKKIDVRMGEFPEVLQAINSFWGKPYAAVMDEEKFEKQWKAYDGSWSDCEVGEWKI